MRPMAGFRDAGPPPALDLREARLPQPLSERVDRPVVGRHDLVLEGHDLVAVEEPDDRQPKWRLLPKLSFTSAGSRPYNWSLCSPSDTTCLWSCRERGWEESCPSSTID